MSSAAANEIGMLQKSGTKVRKSERHAGAGAAKNFFVAERSAGGVAIKKREQGKKTDLAEAGAPVGRCDWLSWRRWASRLGAAKRGC